MSGVVRAGKSIKKDSSYKYIYAKSTLLSINRSDSSGDTKTQNKERRNVVIIKSSPENLKKEDEAANEQSYSDGSLNKRP